MDYSPVRRSSQSNSSPSWPLLLISKNPIVVLTPTRRQSPNTETYYLLRQACDTAIKSTELSALTPLPGCHEEAYSLLILKMYFSVVDAAP